MSGALCLLVRCASSVVIGLILGSAGGVLGAYTLAAWGCMCLPRGLFTVLHVLGSWTRVVCKTSHWM